MPRLSLPSNPSIGTEYVYSYEIPVEEIERHLSAGADLGTVTSTIYSILKKNLPLAIVVSAGLNSAAKLAAYAMKNHGVKAIKVTQTFKYHTMTAFDTDEWVEFDGWDLKDIDIEAVK